MISKPSSSAGAACSAGWAGACALSGGGLFAASGTLMAAEIAAGFSAGGGGAITTRRASTSDARPSRTAGVRSSHPRLRARGAALGGALPVEEKAAL